MQTSGVKSAQQAAARVSEALNYDDRSLLCYSPAVSLLFYLALVVGADSQAKMNPSRNPYQHEGSIPRAT